jgi:hypothetical protein
MRDNKVFDLVYYVLSREVMVSSAKDGCQRESELVVIRRGGQGWECSSSDWLSRIVELCCGLSVRIW